MADAERIRPRFREPRVVKIEAVLAQRVVKLCVFMPRNLRSSARISGMSTLMYLIEGEANGFSSIPNGVYWAIVTLTTVGYGDIVPRTVLGQFVASIIMIMGYGIIAVPTGIFSMELRQAARAKDARVCANCETVESDRLARFCRRCGKPFV